MTSRIEDSSIYVNNNNIFLGLVLSAPFLEALIPVRGITILFGLAYLFFVIFKRSVCVNKVLVRFKNSIILPLIAIIHIWALVFSDSASSNIFWILNFIILYTVYLVFPEDIQEGEVLKTISSILFPIAFLVSLVGVVKLILLQKGVMLLPFYLYYSDTAIRMPGGSSIRSDYNYFSIGILVSGWIFLNYKPVINKYLFTISFFLMIIAIFYSSSRRGFVYLIAFQIIFIILEIFKEKEFSKKIFSCLLTTLAWSLAVYLSMWLILDDVKYSSYKLWPAISGKEFVEIANVYTSMPFDHRFAKYETIKEHLPFDFNSRQGRWDFSLELLKETNYVRPMGYDYQTRFGCQFQKCIDKDYPHNVVLSEWFVGGLIGLILILFCLFDFLKDLFRLGYKSRIGQVMWGIAFFTMPSLFISGDHLFSSTLAVATIILVKILLIKKT